LRVIGAGLIGDLKIGTEEGRRLTRRQSPPSHRPDRLSAAAPFAVLFASTVFPERTWPVASNGGQYHYDDDSYYYRNGDPFEAPLTSGVTKRLAVRWTIKV
jgi:hypothetical protein